MLGDKFTASPNASGVVSERYVLPKGFGGDYQVIIRRAWGEVTSGKATVSVQNHYRSERQSGITRQVDINDFGAVVLFTLDHGRRTEALEDHAIQTVVKNQLSTNRNILAQQIAQADSGYSNDNYYGNSITDDLIEGALGRNNNNNLLNNGPLSPGIVGYTPQIQSIPDGPSLQVNHATTADRLYVMVSVTPRFTAITGVDTFNIFGDAQTAAGLGNTGGQQGGGFGGGQGGQQGGQQGGGGPF